MGIPYPSACLPVKRYARLRPMIGRYSHPLVSACWTSQTTHALWLQIEKAVLDAQIEESMFPAEKEAHVQALRAALDTIEFTGEAEAEIVACERTTKHDVAAFLEWVREQVPHGELLHFGLTSSDLIDTSMGVRFAQLYHMVVDAFRDLISAITDLTEMGIPMLGRTHGQPAEPTSLAVRAWHWLATLEPAMVAVHRHSKFMRVAKLSGPVGTYAHNSPAVEIRAAKALGLQPHGPGASQVVPRTTLALWASSVGAFAAACSKIATDLRLLHLTGEVYWDQTAGQVGSSAMAHKNNPIQAEHVCGLARLAGGYAQMLQPVDLWLERDISNSAVERVAVPDLFHVLMRITDQTTDMLQTLKVDQSVIRDNLDTHPEAWVHKMTLDEAIGGTDIKEARESALIGMSHGDRGGYTEEWFTRNYPERMGR